MTGNDWIPEKVDIFALRVLIMYNRDREALVNADFWYLHIKIQSMSKSMINTWLQSKEKNSKEWDSFFKRNKHERLRTWCKWFQASNLLSKERNTMLVVTSSLRAITNTVKRNKKKNYTIEILVYYNQMYYLYYIVVNLALQIILLAKEIW